ncbi:MAG: beta-propeller fold lactonase family protein [Terrimesophilobacter sp.]
MTELWMGAYTANMGGDGRGICALRLSDHGLQYQGVAAVAGSPSFLVHSANGGMLYAVDEGSGRVEAFARTGRGAELVPVGGQPTTGTTPCHLSVTPEWLYASNYGSGSVDVFPLAEDGSVGPVAVTLNPAIETGTASGPAEEQDGPHAHSTLTFGDTVLVADLGSDRVFVYRWRDGRLDLDTAIEFPAGTGPRDFVVSPVAGKVFVLGELDGSVFTLGGGRNLKIMRAGHTGAVAGDHAAGLAIDSGGRFLYTGLRGSNRVVVLDSLTLEPIAEVPSGGTIPRHLCLVGATLLVANQESGTVASFRIDAETGVPTPSGQPLFVDSPSYLLADVD